jgi:hypothetical protein
MNLFEMAKQVDSKESFLNFVRVLAEDKIQSNVEGDRTADGKLNISPGGWENGNIEAFWDAMLDWGSSTSALTGKPVIPAEPSWSSFALILNAGKSYE